MRKTSNFTYTVYELQQNNFDFGLNDYEIFEENYREHLNNAILEHYKFYEIGYSNPYRWRDRLRERINLIMRTKYNKLYALKDLDFNPLYNVEMTETFEHDITNTNTLEQTTTDSTNTKTTNAGSITNTGENTTSLTSTNEKNSTVKSSQFPTEAMLENEFDGKIYVDAMNRSTDSSSDNSSTTDTNSNQQIATSDITGTNTANNNVDASGTGTTKETYRKFTEGSSAGLAFSKAMLQFQDFVEAFDLDCQVIDDLKDLFLTVWGDDIE